MMLRYNVLTNEFGSFLVRVAIDQLENFRSCSGSEEYEIDIIEVKKFNSEKKRYDAYKPSAQEREVLERQAVLDFFGV